MRWMRSWARRWVGVRRSGSIPGALAHAHDLAHAVENTRLLEWACTVYWRAAAIGVPRTLTQSDLAAVVEAVVQRDYGTTRTREPR
jgi:hypothetical protein